ncbi:MAG TPA: ATPase, T2SS/T4P/T4SS family [Candidatus Saccharimonadales bacterium]|nr:ATPase, T2SS/T4P/T4SS family [Candidatus Saccharimonadales bacterium]
MPDQVVLPQDNAVSASISNNSSIPTGIVAPSIQPNPVPIATSPVQSSPVQPTPVVSTPPVSPTPPYDASSSYVGAPGSQSVLDVLLSQHLLTPAQADEVRVESATENKSMEDVLEEKHIVDSAKIAEAKARMLGVPFISLATTSFSPQALSFIPRAVVDRFQLIPFLYDDKTKTLSVAMSNPVDLEAQQFIRQKTGLTIKTFAASSEDVKDAIDVQYRQELVGEVGKAVKETEALTTDTKTKTISSDQIGQIIKEAPIAKIVATILEYAVTSRASDVHIEPMEDRVRVRYRIDGILYDRLSLPKTVQEAVLSRIKVLSEMKIDEHRSPQDGRFNFKVGDQEVDLRISVLPTVHGEKIVMRLLRKSGGIPTLPDLGLNGTSLKELETAILRPHGIILVCGPTGSGKTTTLYAVLAKLNTTRVNIVSLEDPVEYEIPGVNQVQVNPAVGLTFAEGLRSFLRQDPNIILVGEIRDGETSDLAIQAALTGHLVFSTLHTSNASGALPRLLDLGAETFLLASTITAVMGQRIVRKICDHCKAPYTPAAQLVEEIKANLGPLMPTGEVKLYRGKGCSECGDSGYLGRVGIFEVLTVTEKIAHLILQRSDAEALEKQAVSEGMISMKQDGYLKAMSGVTTIEEVLRVAEE